MITSTPTHAPKGARAEPPAMSLVFGLFSALLALLVMRLVGAPDLDARAYHAGILASGILGTATAWGLPFLRRRTRARGVVWLVVPLAGGVVGALVQALLLWNGPTDRAIRLAVGLSTYEPEQWVLAGIPLGAIPALVATAVLGAGLGLTAAGPGTVVAEDSRERMTVPFAGACAVLAAAALGAARTVEVSAVALVLALAAGALVQVLVADRARVGFLRRVFAGEEPLLEVVSLQDVQVGADLPAVVGSVRARAAIVSRDEASSYRGAARRAVASTAGSLTEATAPLRRRQVAVVALLAVSGVGAAATATLRLLLA